MAGKPVPGVIDLALKDCALQNSLADNLAEGRGARDRARRGRLGNRVRCRVAKPVQPC